MRPPIDVGLFMGSEVKDEAIAGQIDGYGAGARMPAAQIHLPYGFYSRPMDPKLSPDGTPDPNNACQAMYWYEGSRQHQMPSLDPRAMAKLPTRGKGDAMIASGSGAFCWCRTDDGSVTLFTTDNNDPSGHSVFLRVSPTGLEFVAPFGTLRFDASGFHVSHTDTGTRLDLGGIQGIPAPLDAVGAYCAISAPMIFLDSAQTMCGPGPVWVPVISGTPTAPPIKPLDIGTLSATTWTNGSFFVTYP